MNRRVTVEDMIRSIARQEAEAVLAERAPERARRGYTQAEVAKLLGMDPRTVRKHIDQGRLRRLSNTGRNVWILAADLDRFLSS